MGTDTQEYIAIVRVGGTTSGTDQDCHYTSLDACLEDVCGLATTDGGFSGPTLDDAYLTDSGDINAADVKVTVKASTTGAVDTTQFYPTAWMNGSDDNYVEIVPDTGQAHAGFWDDTKYRLVLTDAYAIRISSVSPTHLRFTGIQIQGIDSTAGIPTIYMAPTGAAVDIRFSKNIIRGHSRDYQQIIYADTATAGSQLYVFNNIIYGGTGAETDVVYAADSNWTVYIYNNTMVDGTRGIRLGATPPEYYIFGNIIDVTTPWFGFPAEPTDGQDICDYNWVSANSDVWQNGPGGGFNATFVYVSETDANYLLAEDTDNDAINGSADPSTLGDGSLSFDYDIIGNSRPTGGGWDAGAHELQPAGAGTTSLSTSASTSASTTASSSGSTTASTTASSSGSTTASSSMSTSASTQPTTYTIQPPDVLYSNESGTDGAQYGDNNPTGITDTTPEMSARVYPNQASIVDVRIQVSPDPDFSSFDWDPGWIALDTDNVIEVADVDTDGGKRTRDFEYGEA